MIPEPAREVLDTWFGSPDSASYPERRMSVWFGGGEAFDASLRERFGELLASIAAGEDDPAPWTATPRGLLARVILIDQFTRNIHRGTAQMYGLDEEAVDLTLIGLQRGYDRTLHPVETAFLLMPLMHAESVALQRHCVRCFEELAARTEPGEVRDMLEGNVRYAIAHRDIVERFGRFPHRNALLGRETSPLEARFLMTPNSSF